MAQTSPTRTCDPIRTYCEACTVVPWLTKTSSPISSSAPGSTRKAARNWPLRTANRLPTTIVPRFAIRGARPVNDGHDPWWTRCARSSAVARSHAAPSTAAPRVARSATAPGEVGKGAGAVGEPVEEHRERSLAALPPQRHHQQQEIGSEAQRERQAEQVERVGEQHRV